MQNYKANQTQITKIIIDLIKDKNFSCILKEFNKLKEQTHASKICQLLLKRLQASYNQIVKIIEIVLKGQNCEANRFVSEKYIIQNDILTKISRMAEQSKKYQILQSIINKFYQKETQISPNYNKYFQQQFYKKIAKISQRLQVYYNQTDKIKKSDPCQYNNHFTKKQNPSFSHLQKNQNSHQKSSNLQIKSQKGYKLEAKIQSISQESTDLQRKTDHSELIRTNNSDNNITEFNKKLIQILKMSELLQSLSYNPQNIQQSLTQIKTIIKKSNKLKKNVDDRLALKKNNEQKEKQYKKIKNKFKMINQQMIVAFREVTGNSFQLIQPSDNLRLYIQQLLSVNIKNQDKIPSKKVQNQLLNSTDEVFLSSLMQKNDFKSFNKQQMLDIIRKVHAASLVLNDNVINLQRHQKQFIINVIEKSQNKLLQKSKILRSYDEKNIINPHQYIDKHSNLLLVIRLQNDQVIAAYSQKPILSDEDFIQSMKSNKNHKNVLMNVTRTKYFYQRQNIEPSKYHKYRKNEIIFANGDLELNITERIVKSKFGTINSSFQDNGMGPNGFIDFKAPQIDTIKWKSWEFLKIFFNNGNYNQQFNQRYLKSIKNALVEQKDKQCQTQIHSNQLQAQYIQIKPNIKFKRFRQKKSSLSYHKIFSLFHGPNIKQIQREIDYASQIIDLEGQRQQQISKLQQQITNLRRQLDQIYDRCVELQREKDNSQKRFQLQKKRIQQEISFKNPAQNSQKLLNGRIFYNEYHKDEKKYLISLIQKRQRRKIKGTYFIYQYDELNLNNFHMYIDNVPNLLLIVKTVSGNILGGFTKEGICQKKISKNGFIYTATKKTHFQIDPQKTGIVAIHQPYFLIFGNSELRIKTQDNIVFSNFAILNSYFDTKNLKVDFFLGENGNRQALIDTFQFYRIDFE